MADTVNGWTTSEVLERLNRLGLGVTANQLRNDTAAGFLPPRAPQGVRQGRGRTGNWEPWMVRRAERLYRLRRRKDPSGDSVVYGDTLRLLLFYRDGWGWSERISTLCFEALEKMMAATVAPVRRVVHPSSDRAAAEWALEVHDVALTPAHRFAAGAQLYGEAFEGGSLRGVFALAQTLGLSVTFPSGFVKMMEPWFDAKDSIGFTALVAEKTLGRLTARTSKKLFKSISDEDAQREMPRICAEFIRPLRSYIHRDLLRHGQLGRSSNPLTLSGRKQREIEQIFRERGAPGGITPAQMLAGLLGYLIVGGMLARIAESWAKFAIKAASKLLNLPPPKTEAEILPFIATVMRRVFGVSPQRATLAATGDQSKDANQTAALAPRIAAVRAAQSTRTRRTKN